MGTELIDQPYGEDLDTLAATLAAIVERYFRDPDGLVYACLNGTTNRPYTDADPDLDYPLERTWFYNGSFPFELKRTMLNYEDSAMTTGELLQAYVARARVSPAPEHLAAAEDLAGLMLDTSERVGRENPFGYGFLPKLHGGLGHLHEVFEFSADQLLKWMSALDAYRDFTPDPDRRRRVDELFLATARWLDERDFAVSYMGTMGWTRLTRMRHYLATMAYVLARGYEISGDGHLLDECHFFRDRLLFHSDDPPSANTLNLILEALERLLPLQPEAAEAWRALARRCWDSPRNPYRPEGTPRYGLLWNESHRMCVNYQLARRLCPEIAGAFDVPGTLLRHRTKAAFYHLTYGQEIPADFDDGGMGLRMYVNIVLGLAYASWLRAYWMWTAEGD